MRLLGAYGFTYEKFISDPTPSYAQNRYAAILFGNFTNATFYKVKPIVLLSHFFVYTEKNGTMFSTYYDLGMDNEFPIIQINYNPTSSRVYKIGFNVILACSDFDNCLHNQNPGIADGSLTGDFDQLEMTESNDPVSLSLYTAFNYFFTSKPKYIAYGYSALKFSREFRMSIASWANTGARIDYSKPAGNKFSVAETKIIASNWGKTNLNYIIC